MESCRTFLKREHASSTVEFVALMPLFLFLTFFIFEISVAVLSVGMAEKAVQVGARLAIVSNSAVTTLTPTTANLPKLSTNPPGTLCTVGATTNCLSAWSPATCTGGTGGQCDTTNCLGATKSCFNVIVDRMTTIYPTITAANVSITYSYAGLGFVGGPVVPRITLTLGPPGTAIAYDSVTTNLMVAFFSLINRTSTASPLVNLPTISVTMTGEDLNTAGAS